MNMKSTIAALSLVLAMGCAAHGQESTVSDPAPSTAEAGVPVEAPSTDPAVDEVLDALHRRGDGLRDFAASVVLRETDSITMDSFERVGRVYYQKPDDANARLRVVFEHRRVGNRQREQRVEYLLQDEWLWDRDYENRLQVKRQVLRPGERVNLLKLGEGPFPLPIGQPREDVYAQFDVKMLKGDTPANHRQVRLIPRPGSQFERNFSTIDVVVDMTSGMPVQIQTTDADGATSRTTILSDLKVNEGLPRNAFELQKIDEKKWDLREEPLR
jgi:outer membrane lipoprotein-sorting protein